MALRMEYHDDDDNLMKLKKKERETSVYDGTILIRFDCKM